MIITKKALQRRTFLRGVGTTLALPLLDAMIPSMTAQSATAAVPVRRLGFVYIPMGTIISQWTPPGPAGMLGELSPTLHSLTPYKDQLNVFTNMELKNAYPGTHATSNSTVPERGQSQVDGEHGLLPGHHGRSDRRQAHRPGHARALARTRDGPADPDRGHATTATHACIRTTSPGRRRPRRCRPKRIRARFSSGCLGKAAARRSAALNCGRAPACWIG